MNNTFSIDGFSIQAHTQLSPAAKEFETALLAQPRIHPIHQDHEEVIDKINLSLPQQTLWLQNSAQRFVLFQLSTPQGLPAGQIVVTLYRSKKLPLFGHAVVLQLASAFVSHEAELAAYKAVKEYVSKISWVCTLRIQAMRIVTRDLLDFENLCRRAGFQLVDPVGVTRTLIFDTTASADDLLTGLDKKTRAKVRHASRDKVEIRELSGSADIAALQVALNASFARSQGSKGYLDFDTYVKIAQNHPDRALVLGLYIKTRPTELMAYLINVRHDTHTEAVSSGSLSDPELRKLHFNYFLFWERAMWAKNQSNTFLDMGGVTDGGSTDPLGGISSFKRHFSKKEMEIGREMQVVLRPYRNLFFKFLKKVLNKG